MFYIIRRFSIIFIVHERGILITFLSKKYDILNVHFYHIVFISIYNLFSFFGAFLSEIHKKKIIFYR